jgi:hypothetical protein
MSKLVEDGSIYSALQSPAVPDRQPAAGFEYLPHREHYRRGTMVARSSKSRSLGVSSVVWFAILSFVVVAAGATIAFAN